MENHEILTNEQIVFGVKYAANSAAHVKALLMDCVTADDMFSVYMEATGIGWTPSAEDVLYYHQIEDGNQEHFKDWLSGRMSGDILKYRNREETLTQNNRAMLSRYAEIRGMLWAIREGVKEIRKGIEMCKKQGLPNDGLCSVIENAKEEYRKLRCEGFQLWQKLLRIMSAQEILQACEAYIAECREVQRKHAKE